MTLNWSSQTNNTIKLAGVATDPLLDLNTYPSLDLQFATTKTLNDEVSGTPLVDHQRRMDGANASAGTFVNSSGLIETSKVNLLKYSEEFETTWLTLNLESIATTSNTETSPYGTITADKIIWTNAATSGGYVAQGSTDRGTATNPIVLYTLTGTGTAAVVSALAAGSSYDIDPVGNGWYRCWLYDSTAGQTLSVYAKAGEFDRIQLQFYSTNRYIYVRDSVATQGDGTSGIYLWGAQLEESSTPSPYIKTTNYPSAAPRFDHDPSTNASLGLLIEENRENLFRYSDYQTDIGWSYVAITRSFNQSSPDGQTNAILLAEDGTNSDHYITRPDVSVTASNTYCLSVYLKKGTGATAPQWMELSSNSNGFGLATATFDIENGVRGSADASIIDYNIIDAGDGWYRCWITLNAVSTTANSGMVVKFNNNQSTPQGYGTGYVGQATSDVFVFGGQLEAGSFPTSYIPTSGTTATRAADTANITGSNFSSWYNSTAGSFYVQEDSRNNALGKYYMFVSDGANSDILWLSKDSTNRHVFRVYDSANTLQVVSVSPNLPSSSGLISSKFVGSYFSGDSNSALNGSISGTTSNNAFIRSGSNSAYLGRSGGGNYLNGHLSRLTYYPYRLADATLQTITS